MAQDHGSVFVRVWRRAGEHHDSAFAAAISYFVLFSIIPMLSFLVAMVGYVVRDPVQQQSVADRVLQSLPLGTSQGLIFNAIHSASNQKGTLTIIGLIGLVWSASGMFGAIREALNVAWGARHQRGFIAGKLENLGGVLGFGLLMLLSMAGTIVMHLIQTPGVLPGVTSSLSSVGPVVQVIGFTVPALIALYLWSQFPAEGGGQYQFLSSVDLGLGAFGINLKLGLNGIALPMFFLAATVGLAAGIYALRSGAERL